MNEMNNYNVSVCIASFNGEKFIKEQIESILKQLEENDEIIISDNNSTDRTIEIIENFKDSRIKVFTNKREISKNLSKYEGKLENIYFNFKNAFEKSKNGIVFLSDQDDIWVDDKYAIIKNFMKEYDFVAHDCLIMYEKNFVNSEESLFSRNITTQQNLSYFNLIKNNPFLGCCIAFKRNIGIKAFKYNSAIIPHDTWLALIGYQMDKKKFLVLPKPLLYYRLHENNNSYSSNSKNSIIFKFKYRFKLIFFLIKNYIYAK